MPIEAINASLGCANPLFLAQLKEGEIVLDLGSGGGIDVLLATRYVGNKGKIYRLDMTDEMLDWLLKRDKRHKVIIIEEQNGNVSGWASLNVFDSRCCYSGVVDISIYIEREKRGTGLGKILLKFLIQVAGEQGFHKLVLSYL